MEKSHKKCRYKGEWDITEMKKKICFFQVEILFCQKVIFLDFSHLYTKEVLQKYKIVNSLDEGYYLKLLT